MVCIFQYFFKQVEKDKNLRNYLSGEVPFPQPKNDIQIGNQYNLSSIIEKFRTIKKANICLFKKGTLCVNKTPIVREAILIFSIFFSLFFEAIMELNFDFNVYSYNSSYLEQTDISLPESYFSLIKGYEPYRDMFVANEIIFRNLLSIQTLQKVSITMFESYQFELNAVLQKELIIKEKIFKENNFKSDPFVEIKKNKKIDLKCVNASTIENEKQKKFENILLYFFELYGKNSNLNIIEMNFHFNSLDPLLFYSINQIIKNNCKLINLRMSFFNMNKININKLYLNNFYFNEALEKSKYPNERQINILLNYLRKEERNKKLLDFFDLFNFNLKELSILLSKNLQNYNTLSFNFSLGNNSNFNIYLSDDYKITIILFLCNLLSSLQTQTLENKLNSLSFFVDDYNQSNQYLFSILKNQYTELKNGFDLTKVENNLITFAIPNISMILPFENFPHKNLAFLELHSFTINDFSALCNCLDKNIHLFKALNILSISFDYLNDENDIKTFSKLFKHFIEDLLIPQLENIFIEFKHSLSQKDLYDLLYYIRNCKFHNVKQKTISFEFKICDKESFDFVIEKHNKNITLQNSFIQKFKQENINRKIKLELSREKTKNDNSLALDIYSNNSMISIVHGIESIIKRKNIVNNKTGKIFEIINKFRTNRINKKVVYLTMIE